MARMRWMKDPSGRPVVVCLHCDRELPADPARTLYCHCRSRGREVRIIAYELPR